MPSGRHRLRLVVVQRQRLTSGEIKAVSQFADVVDLNNTVVDFVVDLSPVEIIIERADGLAAH